MKIVALISTYEENEYMLKSCIESASMLDEILVFDGSTKAMKNDHGIPQVKLTGRTGNRFMSYKGHWKSDAEKRTEMLKEAQALWDDDNVWALWLDSDEILLYGEYLKDHCYRADQETATGGTTIRIVEYDGSVAQCFGKLIKVDAIRRYVMSSYEIELKNGMTVALPNVPICSAGGLPIGEIKSRDDEILALNRPPLIGEPHLLHRHGLRNPDREVPRLHEEEAKDFDQMVRDADLGTLIKQEQERRQ